MTTFVLDGDTTIDEPDAHEDARSEGSQAVVWVSAEGEVRTAWLAGRNELIVGRGSDCDLTLPGSLSSRRHARLYRSGKTWLVHDLESRNGVSVNGEAVTTAAVSTGDVIRVGGWLGIPQRLSAEPRYGLLADGLFGGPALERLVDQARVTARSGISVVLEGATGTGKEQLARLIHAESQRNGAFVPVNCAVYQGAMAVAELFGYRKGAFTGAERVHVGMIRSAEGGTLLLDEVTDLAPAVQAQLLRVLETRELVPLGESQAVRIDVRFLSATQEPLRAAVDDGRFRADLRARLEGQCFSLPPLRERLNDIPLLFLHLLRTESAHAPKPDARVLERVCLHDWPLNVREMLALVRRIVTAHPRGEALGLEQVEPLFPKGGEARNVAQPQRRKETLPRRSARAFSTAEVAALEAALARHGGNVTQAAAELKISRQRAYRMLQKGSE